MSTRTILEINHDYLDDIKVTDIASLLITLMGSRITGQLNWAQGKPVDVVPGVRVLAQRHHSETLKLEVR